MRKKRKFKKAKNNFPLFFAIIVLTLCVGYSIFGESLLVKGNIVTNYVISGNVLNIKLMQTNGKYTTGDFSAGVIYNNELQSGNQLTINFSKVLTNSKNYSGTYTVSFKNIYPYSLTNGTISTVKVSGDRGVKSFSSKLSNPTVIKDAMSSFTTNIVFRTNDLATINLRTTITYVVNGVSQSFIYNIVID